jgi:hypothetical protein
MGVADGQQAVRLHAVLLCPAPPARHRLILDDAELVLVGTRQALGAHALESYAVPLGAVGFLGTLALPAAPATDWKSPSTAAAVVGY